MAHSPILLTLCILLLQNLVSAGPILSRSSTPHNVPFPLDPERFPPVTRFRLTSQQVQRELGPLLSRGSMIFGPTDNRWESATERYQTFAIPDVRLVVRPGREEDVAKIVSTLSLNC
jgi:hypothetical protein